MSVIPLRPRTKRPLVPWAEFQQRRASETEVQRWWIDNPDAGTAIVGGRVSSIAVVDDDPRNGGDTSLAPFAFPTGPRARTGAGGHHRYFALAGEPVPKITGLLPGVDIQGEGAYVVAPPSIHPNGTAYAWEPGFALGTVPLPSMPGWLRRLLRDYQQAHRLDRRPSGGGGDAAGPEVTTILGRLHGVRRCAGGWIACCPAHDDQSPSLSIGIGESGRVLLHCFAGCPYPAIRAALAVTL
jgi:hypothetical protein